MLLFKRKGGGGIVSSQSKGKGDCFVFFILTKGTFKAIASGSGSGEP